jgi:hypothetical protein
MNDKKNIDVVHELNNLLQLLAPELSTFKELVKDMAKINSPYQSSFNYIKILVNKGNQQSLQPDIEKTVSSIVEEFNQFGLVLNQISMDDEFSKLYLEEGLMDKCLNLQKNMAKKIGFSI